MKKHSYDEQWFENLSDSSRAGAAPVLAAVREFLPRINSILDVGCGSAEWLSVAREIWSTDDILGVDHPETAKAKLAIREFRPHDLTTPLDLGRRFDLVMSLEVAEHLDATFADRFVDSLARHGDRVLFSAAIPWQGGTHHVNEQWPHYWISRFQRHGYTCHDILRPKLWDDDRVPYWYRQNAMLFLRGQGLRDHPSWGGARLVHPDAFHAVADPERVPGGHALSSLTSAMRRRIRRLLR